MWVCIRASLAVYVWMCCGVRSVCMWVSMYVRMDTCMYVGMHTCMHICRRVSVYACKRAGIYACLSARECGGLHISALAYIHMYDFVYIPTHCRDARTHGFAQVNIPCPRMIRPHHTHIHINTQKIADLEIFFAQRSVQKTRT